MVYELSVWRAERDGWRDMTSGTHAQISPVYKGLKSGKGIKYRTTVWSDEGWEMGS